MVGGADDPAQQRSAGEHVLAVVYGRRDVEVLELVARRPHEHRRAVDQARRAGHDRIDGRSLARGDVDAVVELEQARPLQAVGEHRVPEAGARVAEVGSDRMLLVERLDRPRVRGRVRAGHESRHEREEDEHEAPHDRA